MWVMTDSVFCMLSDHRQKVKDNEDMFRKKVVKRFAQDSRRMNVKLWAYRNFYLIPPHKNLKPIDNIQWLNMTLAPSGKFSGGALDSGSDRCT